MVPQRKPKPRRLVYYVVGGSPEYAALLHKSVASIREVHGPEELDIAVLCSEAYQPHVEARLSDLAAGVRMVRIPDPGQGGVAISMCKLLIFHAMPDLVTAYDVVLFLDCDTLVLGPLDELFEGCSKDDTLYTFTEEKGRHTDLWFGLQQYTPEQLEGFEADGIRVFNCGHFMFGASERMGAHFDAVCRLVSEHRGQFFYEQSFMNHYFNSARKADPGVLTGRVHFPAQEKPSGDPRHVIAHFAEWNIPWNLKLMWMEEYCRRLRQLRSQEDHGQQTGQEQEDP